MDSTDFHSTKRWSSSPYLASSQVRGQELLQALEGLSPWADAKKIRELLRLRQDYFLDTKWDPERSRFSCPLAEGIRLGLGDWGRAGRIGAKIVGRRLAEC